MVCYKHGTEVKMSSANRLARYRSRLKLKNGKTVFLRPVLHNDRCLIVDLFGKLDLDSIYRRFLSYIHVLPEELLFQFTHIDYDRQFAIIALTEEEGKDSAVAVARYGYGSEEDVTDLAVTVRDDWQNNGLGKSLLLKIISIGREHGISRFVSTLDPANNIIKHILREIGHRVKYSYKDGSTVVEIFVLPGIDD